MASKGKDNSSAWTELGTRSVSDRVAVKNAAASGAIEDFKIVLGNIKFPMNSIADMKSFMVSCKYVSTVENGMWVVQSK